MSDLSNKDKKLMRIGPLLIKILDEIGNQETKRCGINPSYYVKGEILAGRINAAGGLK